MKQNLNEHAAAALLYNDNDDSENEYENDFDDVSSIASSIFSDYDPFLTSDHSTLESGGEVMSNLDILEQVEQQRRSTELEYVEDKSAKDGSSDDDDSTESIDEDIDNSSVQSFIKSSIKSARSRRAREEAVAAADAKATQSNEEMSFQQYLAEDRSGEDGEINQPESNLSKEGNDLDVDIDGLFSSHRRSHSQYYGKQFGSNRTLKSRGGVSSRPKAKYSSRMMRRDLRRAGGFDSGDDSNEELIGSTSSISSYVKALCNPLPGPTKLGQRSSLSDYIDPYPASLALRSGDSKHGKTMKGPLDFRRLIVLVAMSAAMTFAIGLSKHGMGHVDRQIAKQIEELERRAKEMESPSEKLRMEMYANSLQNTLQTTESSKEDSIAADPINEDEPPSINQAPDDPSIKHQEMRGRTDNNWKEIMSNPDLVDVSSSETISTGDAATLPPQDDKSQPQMAQVLSPEQMKLLTPEQQQQFLIMQFQRMQYQNQFERMQETISKVPEEVKRLLGMPLETLKRRLGIPMVETIKRRMNSSHLRRRNDQNQDLHYQGSAMPIEVVQILPEDIPY